MNVLNKQYFSDKRLHTLINDPKVIAIKTTAQKYIAPGLSRAFTEGTFDEIFLITCKRMRISLDNGKFVYFIDWLYQFDNTRGYRFENLTPNYEKFLKNGLSQLKYPDIEVTNKFCISHNNIIDGLILLCERIVKKLNKVKPYNYMKKIEWFSRMQSEPADSFAEALQRVLFLNQMFWQMDHKLTGLGAMDSILYPYYTNDISTGCMTKDSSEGIIGDFFNAIHKYYWYKSNVLLGDTGQIIVLGKTETDGSYCCNELTHSFINVLKKVQLPDPKILLRVSSKTPDELLRTAIDCIITGVGSPLFSNDDVIVPKLVDFGIDRDDALHYVTSACWEPLIGGKSTSLNNMSSLNFMRSMDNLFNREPLEKIKTFDEFFASYKEYLSRNLCAIIRVLGKHRHQYYPLLSVFIDGCYEGKKDVSAGGAKYMHQGMTSMALGNTVNALLNVKKYVFDENRFTLAEVRRMLKTNFENCDAVRILLKENSLKYGTDDKRVIDMVNEIIRFVSSKISGYRSYLGGKLKFGLSAPLYIEAARGFPASFDGRGEGEPFNVHISSESAEAYTELLSFAGSIDYGENRFNGNVVDFLVAPDFVKNNLDKFINIIRSSITVGFFQMQMNVLSSEILIEAKKNPDKYPNLIVRVWGFSSYFNDLPDEYKDVLIQRALENEGKVA